VREAINLAFAAHKDEILQRCHSELFGNQEKENEPPSSSVSRCLLIELPKEVWSDETLKAKAEGGATLTELLEFLHSNVHPLFVKAFDGHQFDGKMWGTTHGEGRGKSPEKKREENSAGGR
jgi:hypothetical protein